MFLTCDFLFIYFFLHEVLCLLACALMTGSLTTPSIMPGTRGENLRSSLQGGGGHPGPEQRVHQEDSDEPSL